MLLRQTIENIVVERPEIRPWNQQHLCLDKGYDNPTGHEVVEDFGYVKHIARKGKKNKQKKKQKRYPARRWVVERTLSWLSRCRAILTRYEKKTENYLGLVQIACALLWYRRMSVP
jgi:putative transposase